MSVRVQLLENLNSITEKPLLENNFVPETIKIEMRATFIIQCKNCVSIIYYYVNKITC